MVKRKRRNKKTPQESGVNEFVTRLRKKGVDEGKYRANELVKSAAERSEKILSKAETDAAKILSDAKKQAHKMEKSAKESIKIAFRDSVLELKTLLQDSFIRELKRIVKEEVSDKKVLKQMILKVVENSSDKDKKEILIADPIKDGDIINASVYGITKDMFKGGIVLKNFSSIDKEGIIIKETKKGLEIDLTDKAISELLLDHLLPTYKNLLNGDK